MAHDELDPRLAELLDGLKSVPERDPRAALRGKNKFLAEAVSLSESRRHSGWTTIFQNKKEKFSMNILVSALIIAGLLFGGGATVSAAQDALPTDALYTVKLLSEDAQLWLNGDPAVEIELLMQQAQTRTQEVAALNAEGIVPPTALAARAQERIQQALEVAAMLDKTEVPSALLQIRDQLQTQDRLLSQLQDGTCADCEPILLQTRDMLRDQLRLVEDGLADPAGFIHRNRAQNGTLIPEPSEVPATESSVVTVEPAAAIPAVTPQASCTPVLDGSGQQNGNQGTSQQNGQGQSPSKPETNDRGNGQLNNGRP